MKIASYLGVNDGQFIINEDKAHNSREGTHKQRKSLKENGNKKGTYHQNQKAIGENTRMHN